MMKNFVVHDETGKIIRFGLCQEADLPLQAINPGETVIEAYAFDPARQWVMDGEVITNDGDALDQRH